MNTQTFFEGFNLLSKNPPSLFEAPAIEILLRAPPCLHPTSPTLEKQHFFKFDICFSNIMKNILNKHKYKLKLKIF